MNFKHLAIAFTLWCTLTGFQDNSTVIYMIGDSTVADKAADKYPITGWGQVFGDYFTSAAKIKNRALDGRTTRSFLEEGHWKPIMDSLKAGDYVFIEFGHNDEKVNIPKLGVALEDYKDYLRKFIADIRSKKAHPILLTQIMRRNFVNGVLVDTHGKYADAVRQIGSEEKVPVIDLQRKTEKLINQYGEKGSQRLFNWVDSAATPAYPKGSKDNTHLSRTGALAIASLVADDIREQHLSIASLLKVK